MQQVHIDIIVMNDSFQGYFVKWRMESWICLMYNSLYYWKGVKIPGPFKTGGRSVHPNRQDTHTDRTHTTNLHTDIHTLGTAHTHTGRTGTQPTDRCTNTHAHTHTHTHTHTSLS